MDRTHFVVFYWWIHITAHNCKIFNIPCVQLRKCLNHSYSCGRWFPHLWVGPGAGDWKTDIWTSDFGLYVFLGRTFGRWWGYKVTSKVFWLPAILRQEISPKKFQRYENTLFFKLILHNKNSNKVRNIILRARKYLPGTLQLWISLYFGKPGQQ